jgi:mono/diheme cytochrome c family protein
MPASTDHTLARALVVATILGFLAWPSALRAELAAAKITIESWVRPPGDAEAVEAGTLPRTKVDLDSLPLTQARRFDAQYGKQLWFEGVPLTTLLTRLGPPASVDLALLHFANGMVVPLPFRDPTVLSRLEPFIALRTRTSAGAPFASEFPPLTRKAREYADVPLTRFSANKMVVTRLWHPAIGDKVQADFSPWTFVDSLVAVEFVEAAPYYKQFDVDSRSDAQAGLTLFRQTCQFCHGARKVGAKFGWDFVEPAPLYSYRKGGTRLYYHVHFRRYDAIERGQHMPALKFMTQADAGTLWQWLKAIGTRPMLAYSPSH